MNRTYTRAEIDHMRESIEADPVLYRSGVEERLRTYILAGVDPADFKVLSSNPIMRRQEEIARMAERGLASDPRNQLLGGLASGQYPR